MNQQHSSVLSDRLRHYDLEALLTILGPERMTYTAAAVEAAESELRSRGLADAILQHLRGYGDRRAVREAQELEAIHSLDRSAEGCHICGNAEVLARVPFGLKSAAVREIAVPGTVIKLHLHLCGNCLIRRIDLTEQDCARHPAVERDHTTDYPWFVHPLILDQSSK